MPGLMDLYAELTRRVAGSLSHPLRGIVTEVQDDDGWFAQNVRTVSVRVTPSGASYPRDYTGVPWNSLAQTGLWQHKPAVGDYVDLVFKGGSSEFPAVVGFHPGTATSLRIAAGQASRAEVPAESLLSAAPAAPGAPPAFSFDPSFGALP